MNKIYAVLMAGGAGVRFWPLGRQALPKQFLNLPGCDFGEGCSMLQRTARRLERCVSEENLLVATGGKYKGLVRQQLPWLPTQNLIEEEKNLDTAFAVAGALQRIGEICGEGADPVVAFLPCDHYIDDDGAFAKDFMRAVGRAEQGKLVTLGVRPIFAATEYGYMQSGAEADETCRIGEGFLEKPDRARAEELWQREDMFWNCGIFVGRMTVYLRHLQRQMTARGCLSAGAEGQATMTLPQQAKLVKEALLAENLKISFDKLVMEKLAAGEFLIVPASFIWDDLGTFTALGKYWRQADGNRVKGCKAATIESRGNIVYREGGLVALVGVQDLLVVEADGALLVMPKDESRRLRELVGWLAEHDSQEYL